MRFCGLGMHFAPEAHFTASLGPDRRTCVDCREQQARRRRKSAAKKRAVGRIVSVCLLVNNFQSSNSLQSQRRGRVCRKSNKTLFLDCFDTKKNGMLNKRCRTCAVQMSRAKNRPFWVKQKARYQKSRWMAAIRIAEEMRGERAADHDAIGNMGSSIDGAGSVRDVSCSPRNIKLPWAETDRKPSLMEDPRGIQSLLPVAQLPVDLIMRTKTRITTRRPQAITTSRYRISRLWHVLLFIPATLSIRRS